MNKLNIPQFLIIGANICCEGKILININNHPDIFVHNEIHYFDYYWKLMPKEWYYNMFMQSDKLIKGEINRTAIYINDSAKRIKKICPNTKFLLFLCNPIERAYNAWWNMTFSDILEKRSFKDCVEYNIANLNEKVTPYNSMYQYVQMGFYMDQIERFMKVFPKRNNILIIITEWIKKKPEFYYEQIFKFLGAKNKNINLKDIKLTSYLNEIDSIVKNKLFIIYKAHNQRLFDFLGYTIPEWNKY